MHVNKHKAEKSVVMACPHCGANYGKLPVIDRTGKQVGLVFPRRCLRDGESLIRRIIEVTKIGR